MKTSKLGSFLSAAGWHAAGGAQRPPSWLQAGWFVKLARLSTKPLRKTPWVGQARALPTLSIRPSHTPRVPAHSDLRRPRRDTILSLLPTGRSRETWARRGAGGKGAETQQIWRLQLRR